MRASSGALIFSMCRYALSPNIHAARLNGIYVLLDECADRYLCLTEAQSGLLADILAGDTGSEACRFATALAARQILIAAPIAPPLRRALPWATSSVYRTTASGHLRAREWLPTFRVLREEHMIRKRPLSETLDMLRREKASCQRMKPNAPEVAGKTAARFTALCDLFLTRTDACLPRSLLLTRFLLLCHMPADFVIGVKLGPFAAHAWVECAGNVVNDHLETVQEYVPILSI